jgi:hypothetical protein
VVLFENVDDGGERLGGRAIGGASSVNGMMQNYVLEIGYN